MLQSPPERKKRVCLFGTSADPPTGKGGHEGIVTHLASISLKSTVNTVGSTTLPYFDEIRVLPVYRHMFREKRNKQASYEDRMKLCRLAFQNVPNVIVSDDERRCFEWTAGKNMV